ncbi:MAG TPA: hypothetical protein VFP04_07115, partial [Nitrospira sp.]|nr:hypothetical protein [Nitrospira sp.]
MSDHKDTTSTAWVGVERRVAPQQPLIRASEPVARLPQSSHEPERQKRHLRPVWILLLFLIPCVALTLYYGQVVVPGGEDPDSFFPTTSYALVLLLITLDLIGF